MSERDPAVEDAGDLVTCNVCGKRIEQPRGSGRRRKTCSPACRQKSYMLRNFEDRRTGAPVEPRGQDVVEPVEVAWIPAPAVPDPPAAPPVIVPLPAPKAPRRRSTMSTSAIPLPPAEPSPHGRAGGDHAGWLAAFSRIVPEAEQQPGLFEVEADDEG